ncbi:MAG: ArsC/Spx/MgsR family protein [Candidatus Zixiibacteriota bacterium]
MLKTIELFLVPNDPGCSEVVNFLEEQEFRVKVRDLSREPLRLNEITRLMRHFNLRHFLNSEAKGFTKHHLNNTLPPRDELFQLMAEDNELIKKPIVVAGRLMVVGPNIPKIREMLQIKSNGNGSDPTRRPTA